MKSSEKKNVKKRHKAYYGLVDMERVYCPQCDSFTLVIDEIKQCCDTPVNEDLCKDVVEYVIEPVKVRMTLKQKDKKKLLDLQGHRCIYCGIRFGTIYFHKGQRRVAKAQYDHFEPFIYGYDNRPSNFIVACKMCNGIKGSKCFDNFEEAQNSVLKRRLDKGLKIYNDWMYG